MAYAPVSSFPSQFFDSNGRPLSGGTVSFYAGDTTVPATVYSDGDGTAAGVSITLDSRGEPETIKRIWLDTSVDYKAVVKSRLGETIYTIYPLRPAEAVSILDSDVATGTKLDNRIKQNISVLDRFPSAQVAAVIDGTTSYDCATELDAADAADALVFGRGTYYVGTNVTLTNKCYFEPGAKLKIADGVTVTFDALIESPRQRIFEIVGTGAVSLNGEASHLAYPEWFGAFPNESATDAAPLLQKLSDAVVAGRECLVLFSPGTWYLGQKVTWSRACRILGDGERITHFRCNASFTSGDVFDTSGEGVTFENIQFSSVSIRTSGRYIHLANNYCRAFNIWFTDGHVGVEASGNDCEIDLVQGFTWNSGAGSCLVNLADNSFRCGVDRVKMLNASGSDKPENIVRVGAARDWVIGRVSGTGAGVAGVALVPSSGECSGGQIDEVRILGNAVNALLINPTGTSNLYDIQVGRIRGKSLTGAAAKIQKDTSNNCKYIDIESVMATSCVDGFVVDASAGSVDHWSLKGGYARNGSGDGYNISSADYWTITNTSAVSNTGNGTIINAGCNVFTYTDNKNLFNGTNFTDSSGATTSYLDNNA